MSTRIALPGDFQFCPYCGNATIESTSVRTYCFTCGEDVGAPGLVEELSNEVALLTDALTDTERERNEYKDECLKSREKIVSLDAEIDTLDTKITALTEENYAWQLQIAAWAPVQP